MKITRLLSLKFLKPTIKPLLLICMLNSFSSCTNDELIDEDIITQGTDAIIENEETEEIDKTEPTKETEVETEPTKKTEVEKTEPIKEPVEVEVEKTEPTEETVEIEVEKTTPTEEIIEVEVTVDREVEDNNKTQLTEAEELLILVNELRASEGVTPISLNNALNKAAYDHSKDMNINDYFDHTGLNGSRFSDRAKDAGYTGSPVGENIAVGQRDVQSVFNAWESSAGHKRNMLSSRATEMGLGHSGRYWTQIFGRN